MSCKEAVIHFLFLLCGLLGKDPESKELHRNSWRKVIRVGNTFLMIRVISGVGLVIPDVSRAVLLGKGVHDIDQPGQVSLVLLDL